MLRLLVSLVALGSLVGPTTSAQDPIRAPSELLTHGQAQVRLPPDWALVSIGIHTRGASAAAAAARNAQPLRRVRDTLVVLGIQPDSIQTLRYGVEPNYDFERGRRLIDYEARAILSIRLRHLDQLGQLLDAVLAAGATDVSGIEFASDTFDVARRTALGQALASARGDAEAIARAAGGRLGRLLQLTSPANLFSAYGDGGYVFASAPSLGFSASHLRREVGALITVQARWEYLALP